MSKFLTNELEMQILDFATDKRNIWEKNHEIYSAVFEITPKCNFNCVHCYLHNNHADKELTYNEIIEIIDVLYEKGVLFLTLTGGDIFTRSDFIDIYLYAKHKGFIIELYTNGALINDQIIDVFKKFPPLLVDISLYGSNENTYEKVTGIKGAFERVINNIDQLLENNIRVSLKAPLLSIYNDEIDDIKQIATSRNIAFRSGFEISPSIENDDSIQQYQVSDYDALLREFNEYTDRPKKWQDDNWLEKNEIMLVNLERDKPLFRCKLGRASCVIDYEGNMCPCMSFKHAGEKLTRETFDDIWSRYSEYPKMKATPNYKCLKCKAYDLCDICPAMMEFIHNDLEYVDNHFCKVAHARYAYYVEQKTIEEALNTVK